MHLDVPPNEKKRGRAIAPEELCEPMKKRTCTQSEPELSLPNFIYDATAEANERTKAQENHAGKVRQFEHVKGNFPTFLYLKVPPCTELDVLSQSLVDAANDNTSANSTCYNLFPASERHISLSRPFAMRIHQKELYLKELKQEIDECRLRRFTVAFPRAIDSSRSDEPAKYSDSTDANNNRKPPNSISSIARSHTCYFTNEDESRSFLCLLIGANKGKREILTLLAALDRVQRKFDFPVYYENPQPHLSIAWRVNGKGTEETGISLAESEEISTMNTGGRRDGNASLDTRSILAKSALSSDAPIAPLDTMPLDSVLLESTLSLCDYSCSDEDTPLVRTNEESGAKFEFEESGDEEIEWLEYEVREIHCKIGEWSFAFNLRDY